MIQTNLECLLGSRYSKKTGCGKFDSKIVYFGHPSSLITKQDLCSAEAFLPREGYIGTPHIDVGFILGVLLTKKCYFLNLLKIQVHENKNTPPVIISIHCVVEAQKHFL